MQPTRKRTGFLRDPVEKNRDERGRFTADDHELHAALVHYDRVRSGAETDPEEVVGDRTKARLAAAGLIHVKPMDDSSVRLTDTGRKMLNAPLSDAGEHVRAADAREAGFSVAPNVSGRGNRQTTHDLLFQGKHVSSHRSEGAAMEHAGRIAERLKSPPPPDKYTRPTVTGAAPGLSKDTHYDAVRYHRDAGW